MVNINEIVVLSDNKQLELASKFTKELVKLEKQAKALADKEKEIKAKILEVMLENDITRLENADLLIFIRQATTSERFDTKAFREKNPDLYDEYVKISNVSASITIKVKEDK